MKGIYIVFEGVVGTGKTTQSKKLFSLLKKLYPKKEILWTREPGGSEVADAIRKLAQGTRFSEEMDPVCEAYLYAASRAQTLRRVVYPVLAKGGIVVQDNSFITGLSYQGFGRKLGEKTFFAINKVALNHLYPDIVIYLDLDPRLSRQRTFDLGGDKFEAASRQFFRRVYNGYRKISKLKLFKERWININASGSIDEVFDQITKSLNHKLRL